MRTAHEIQSALARALENLNVEISGEVPLEHPTDFENGDYATGVALQCAKQAGTNPRELAERIVAELKIRHPMSNFVAEVAGPGFINFHLSNEAIGKTLEEARASDLPAPRSSATRQAGKWGANENEKGKKVMVEYTDPNPFKEFHIGHLMSNAIGEAFTRLLDFSGAKVIRANYQGDVGLHVAKAIWAYKSFPSETTGTARWGLSYKRGNDMYETDEDAKNQIDEINKKVYEQSDEEINRLYKEGKDSSLKKFEQLYAILGTKFNRYFFESESTPKGIEIVRSHPDVFELSDGATVFHGEKIGLHTRVFITSRGLPTYEAKDLGLLALKDSVGALDESITVTAHEQSDYFRVVIAAAKEVPELLDIATKTKHMTHGMMRFSEGKMSSRMGNIVTGESLLGELIGQAKVRAAESRADDVGRLAEHVAVGAIKYQILKQATGKDIIFNREQALSLEGDSGPYIQYAHARACAIGKKANEQGVEAQADMSAEPTEVSRLIARFPDVVERAARDLEPHLVANYLVHLAGAFNSWYAQEHILDGSTSACHKLALTDAARATLANGLWLLGIPAPERM